VSSVGSTKIVRGLNMANHETMSRCTRPTVAASDISNYNGLRISCDLTYRVSDGPCIENSNFTTMLGDVISVSSFLISS